ncbi:MAG: DUF1302 family protein [Stagnimonas sp.]|nr:DUF1302 family protein [Stagnimonas sp.]
MNCPRTAPRLRRRLISGFAVWLAVAAPASALEFELAGTAIKLENLATVGALLRMQDRDGTLIGKSSLNPGVCVSRDAGSYNSDDRSYAGNTCNPAEMTNGQNANEFFVAQPGSFSPNGDNGNLNFDKYDVVAAASKMTSDLSFSLGEFNFFTRATGYFDVQYANMKERHPDSTAQPERTGLPSDVRELTGARLKFLDYFVSRKFDLGDRAFNVKLGNQVLNWGESAFLLPNSLNAINPADQAILRVPGFDLKELSQPVGMLLLEGDVIDSLGFQAFYQYQWKPVIADPVGSYFSTSDIVGEGGDYAMLSFAKAPEDPGQFYEPARNSDDPAFVLGSRSSRTLLVDHAEEKRRRPQDGGQYGFALKGFLENFNNGTELSFYFANYHARVPSVSGIAADDTCLPAEPGANQAATIVSIAVSCGALDPNDPAAMAQFLTGTLPALAAGNAQLALPREPLPLDTAKLFIEYPENIRMFGTSFNTTLGDFAVSGEYVYRPNLPIQVHSTDLVFAILQPAFPAQDLDLGIAVLPGRRSAVPDFIATNYRGEVPTAGSYVRGWEPMKIGQANLNILKTIGGDNPMGASQITLLLEMGHTHVFDMPGLGELQFNGAGTDTHISSGADGSVGINPRDVRTNPNDPSTSSTDGGTTVRQNPTAWYDRGGFGTADSYGYRLVTLMRYENAFMGANVEFLNTFFHDVEGVGPGLGQNFVEGRKQILSGVRVDYLSRFIGELRYTWFTGGGIRDSLRDRDNMFLSLGYLF